MKNVELPEVKFKPWSYWSDWVDVCAFQFAFHGYILQMQRTRFGKLKFRTAPLSSTFGGAQASVSDLFV